MNKLFVICSLILLSACQSSDKNEVESNNSVNESLQPETVDTNSINEYTPSYTAVSIFDEELGWGYQILNNDKPYINQPHIPAIEGMKGFNTEEDALETAELVLFKLNNNIVPPSITSQELDSLGVVY